MEDQKSRIVACENNIWLFSLYYFTNYHFYEMPEFHKEMYDDLDEMNKELIGLLWEMFRESAKTTIAKIKVIHNIVYKKRHFNIWSSFDKAKANANLFDIVLQLQTNKKLIADFGQMFFSSNLSSKQSEKKSISEFITTNGIKVKSYSTGQSIRGEVFGEYRPDFVILDDIETMKTVVSDAKTRQVIDFVDELLSGASGDCNILVLANRLANTGSVAYIEEKIKGLKGWKTFNVPAVNEDNQPVWKSKYVMTDFEADEINKNIVDKKERVISLETKKRLLGETVYNREMLNRPLTEDEREFRLKWLQNEYEDLILENKTLNRYITIDTASTSEHQANQLKGDPDYFGITIVDVDIEGNWYLRYVKRERLNAPEKVEKIFELWNVWKPIKIGIEEKSFESELKPYIKLKSEKDAIYPVVEELKHHGKNKYERIRGALQGRFQFGKIFFRKNSVDDQDKLKLELYDFPKSKHDDLSDALAYIEQVAIRPFGQVRERYRTEIEQEFIENKNKLRKNVSNVLRRL